MKGNSKIIDALNRLLTHELTASDQYFIHAHMYDDWGLSKLHERIKHEHEEELEHASALIERILFLEGVPNLSPRDELNIGTDVASMLKSDLDIEYAVGRDLKDTMKLCEQEQDYQTREILSVLLRDTEEDHTHWLEQQLSLIKKIGEANYLQYQLSTSVQSH